MKVIPAWARDLHLFNRKTGLEPGGIEKTLSTLIMGNVVSCGFVFVLDQY